MSEHTPGPWTPYRDAYHDTWSVEGDGDVVADLWRLSEETHARHPHYEDAVEANAHLMAAAPELLEALQRLVALHRPLTGNPTHESLAAFWEYEKTQGRGEADDQLFALAAIAKAKGGAA